MSKELIVAILLALALIAVVAVTVFFYLRDKTLNDIRADVYQLFLKAEHMYKSGAGQAKMEFVIRKARQLLPHWTQLIITEDFLKMVVQAWFDAVKDLLDDGRVNQSVKGE